MALPERPTGTVTFLAAQADPDDETSAADAITSPTQVIERLLRAAVERHDGFLPTGPDLREGVVAVFARATDAIRAAVDAQRAFADLASTTTRSLAAVRMGLHTGESRPTDAGYEGPSAARTAQIRSCATFGQVVVSDLVRALTDEFRSDWSMADAGLLRLDGMERPEQLWQVVWDEARPTGPSVQGQAIARTNLPTQPTSFVGRATELDELSALLEFERLVTIVGPGGGGKTRLAHRLGGVVADRHPDGVWWLDLIAVSDASLLASSLSQVLGIPDDPIDPLGSLALRLGTRRCLFLLDNCEHMVTAVADLTLALTKGCPNVHVVATSRTPIGVGGEVVWIVPPLAMPDDAVELFIDRARRVRPNFRAGSDTHQVIAAICARLDGIPLPIELAAARCRVLTPSQILDGLENAIALLTGGARGAPERHQTIEASMAWSHGLLGPDEQVLLRRLSIFEGPFSLDAAEAVCGDERLPQTSVLDLLERLVDQSLVQVIGDGEGDGHRFKLLETVRQFGRHALAVSGGDSSLTERHTAWFADRGASCWPLFVPEMVDLLDLVDRERSDILAALARLCAADDHGRLARAALGALPTLGVRHAAEADEWIERVTAALGDSATAEHGLLLVRWAEICSYRGAPDREETMLAKARALGDAIDSHEIRAHAAALELITAGFADCRVGLASVAEVEALCRRSNNRHDADCLIWGGASWAAEAGDRRRAEAEFDRAATEIRDECPRCEAMRLTTWAVFDLDCGRPGSAVEHAIAGRNANARLADPPSDAYALAAIVAAGVAMDRRDPTTERRLQQAWSDAVDYGDHMAQILSIRSIALLARLADDTTLLRDLIDRSHSSSLPIVVDHAAAAAAASGDHPGAFELISRIGDAAHGGPTVASCIFDRRSGWLRLAANDAIGADEHAHRGLVSAASGPWPVEMIGMLELLATIGTTQGWDVEAARLFGSASRLRETTGVVAVLEPEASAIMAARDTLRSRLGEETFEQECAAGAALDPDQALEYAQRSRGERRRPQFGWAALTPTEIQVASLAGEGLTNPQIATRLLMGRETVKTHLSSVYVKTGLANRAQLAAAIARQPLEE